jgi:hypothetical protein
VTPIRTATNTALKPIKVGGTPGAMVITWTARPCMSLTSRGASSRSGPPPARY